MPTKPSSHSFKGQLWKYDGPAGWCFVTLPKSLSQKIRKNHHSSEEGWGRLKVLITIGNSSWKTAIWFDTKHEAYLLPIKQVIRQKEKIAIGEFVSGKFEIETDRFQI